MTNLNHSHQRAVGDLLQAERDLRQKSEDSVRAMRQALIETANRFDGKRLQDISRDNPAIPSSWDAADWKRFFDEVPTPSQGWTNTKAIAPGTQTERKLKKQIAELQAALAQAELNLESDRAKIVVVESTPVEIPEVEQNLPVADAIESIPPNATPAMTVMVADAIR